jgi:hypothetical protein
MTVLFVALAAGVIAGFVSGGRPSNVYNRVITGAGVLAAAIIFQVISWLLDGSPNAGLVCVIVSYGLLTAFALVNIRLIGMPVVLVGLLLNFTVITVNSGMPVRADAMYTVDRNPGALENTAKRHLETSDDKIAVFGDVLPIEPFNEVISFGDLIMAFGLANVMFRLFQPAPPLYRRRDGDDVVDVSDTIDVRDRVLT